MWSMLTCLMVMAGLQSLSSSRIDRQTVPEGYTLGWNRGGSNLPSGMKNQTGLLAKDPRLHCDDTVVMLLVRGKLTFWG